MLSLSEADVRRLLDPARVISAIENAFRIRYPQTTIPVRTHIDLAYGVFLSMPCYDRSGHALGMKLVVVQNKVQNKVQNNPAHPDERVQATYMLLDPNTGQPKLIIPAKTLTDIRTAATSALATKFLAREDIRTLAIFGTGRQAHAHLEVVPLVRHFDRIYVCGRDAVATAAFTSKLSAGLNRLIEPGDASTCAAADVICTCTTSPAPLFDGKLLRPGTHVNAVGAFQPHTRELDSITVQRARVVVETYDGALAEAGDLLIPMKEGLIGREHIIADLHELMTGTNPGRRSPTDITLFKSVGCALEDLVTAELIQQASAHA